MIQDNKKRKVTSIVENKYSGYRIDNFLSEKFDYHSRNEWQNLIKQEIILLNNKNCKPSKLISFGDKIEFIIEDFIEPECNLDYKIIYEDDYLIAVDKPYNCIIHPVGPFFKNTLSYKLEEDLGHQVFSVNRLDRETTGLVLFGKNSETARILSDFFINRKIYKEYVVAVHGMFPEFLNTKGYLLHDDDSTVRKKRKFQYSVPENLNPGDYETSETDFELIKNSEIKDRAYRELIQHYSSDSDTETDSVFAKGQIIPGSRLLPDAREIKTNHNNNLIKLESDISLVKVKLKTGRQHQIRATLCSLGYPVIGDKLYGLDDTIYLRFIERKLENIDKVKLLINHQALHARKVVFSHPYTKQKLSLEAPVPEEISFLF